MSVTLSSDRSVTSTQAARGPARPAYVVAGLALLGVATWVAVVAGTGISSVLVFAVLPDVALLLALGGDHRPGQLPRRAVPAYNTLHHPVGPVALGTLAAFGLVGTWWLVAALSWAAHIAIDRGAGYGLRGADGWQRG